MIKNMIMASVAAGGGVLAIIVYVLVRTTITMA